MLHNRIKLGRRLRGSWLQLFCLGSLKCARFWSGVTLKLFTNGELLIKVYLRLIYEDILVDLFRFCVTRYASLYFCCAIEQQDNELLTLEIIHRYVELLDKYFGSVSLIWEGMFPSFYLCYMVFIVGAFKCFRFAS